MMTKQRRFVSILLVFASLTARQCAATISVQENLQEHSAGSSSGTDELDDRTYLDLFGEASKQFLTQQVIPDTDAECRWNWKYGRCEPNCDCHFQPSWGDYHLGRACRLRPSQGGISTAPLFCDVPPETTYSILVKRTLERTRAITSKTRTKIALWKNRIQTDTCGELPTECTTDEVYRRSLKERMFCRHIPSPCDDRDNDDDASWLASKLADIQGEAASSTTEGNASMPLEAASTMTDESE